MPLYPNGPVVPVVPEGPPHDPVVPDGPDGLIKAAAFHTAPMIWGSEVGGMNVTIVLTGPAAPDGPAGPVAEVGPFGPVTL